MAKKPSAYELQQAEATAFEKEFARRLAIVYGERAVKKFVKAAAELEAPSLAQLTALARRTFPIAAQLVPSVQPLARAALSTIEFTGTSGGADLQLLAALRRGLVAGRTVKGFPARAGVVPTLEKGHARAAKAVRDHLKTGAPVRKAAPKVAEALDLTRAQAETLVQTGAQEVLRLTKGAKAVELGIELFRYTGPDDDLTRPFCADTLAGEGEGGEGIYSLEEINAMDNGQGLPVFGTGGGWNCRHDWEPVVTAEALLGGEE